MAFIVNQISGIQKKIIIIIYLGFSAFQRTQFLKYKFSVIITSLN